MADVTATTLATYLKEVWSAAASIIYSATTIIEPKMDHRWEPEIGVGAGDTVNIPEFTQATSAQKRSTFGTGATLTLRAPTENQIQLKVDQMAYQAFQMPVEMNAQVMAIYVPLMTDDIGRAIALQIDTELASDNSDGFDALTPIGTDNEPLTETVILEGEQVLNDNNALLETRYMFISPATYADLRQIEVFRNQFYPQSIIQDMGPGAVGKLFTLETYMTNNLEAGTNGKKGAILQKECIAFAAQTDVKVVQDLEITEGLFNVTAGWKAYGFKLIRSTFGREVDAR